MVLANYSDHSKVSEIRYEQPKLNDTQAFSFPTTDEPLWHPVVEPEHPSYRDMFEDFSLSKYAFPRYPIDLGKIDMKPLEQVPNVLRMLIKIKRGPLYVPNDFLPIKPLLEKIIGYEKWINKNFRDFFIHITVDHSEVEADQYHRFPGYHGDGLQGAKFKQKVCCEHSYIAVTAPPTEICLQPFFLKHLDEAKHNMFSEMDRQVRPDNVYQSLPNHLYLFDPYVVHRTPEIKTKTQRTFFRLTVTPEELLMPKNTVNPFFQGQDYPDRIDVRNVLTENDREIPYEMYGLTKRV